MRKDIWKDDNWTIYSDNGKIYACASSSNFGLTLDFKETDRDFINELVKKYIPNCQMSDECHKMFTLLTVAYEIK